MIQDHILFVEDDPGVRTGVLALLEDEFPDYKVEAVESAEQAKETLRKCRARDLLTRVVIVDENLGAGERGSQLLQYLERYYPGVRKIMLESEAHTEDISRAVNKGKLDKYIHKADFRKDHNLLFDAIRNALSEGEGLLYDAVVEVLREAEPQEDEEAAILMAGPKQIRSGALLRDIAQQTSRGRRYMKQFTKLLYSFFLDPEDFLHEIERVRKNRMGQRAKGKERKPKRK